MKTASTAAFLLFCYGLSAQTLIPTPTAQYDALTVSGGAMTDLSGNGNNITLSGTTQGAVGTTCNGSSDYLFRNALVGISDFTILAIASSASGGVFFSDNSANATTASVRMAAGSLSGGSTTQIVGTGASATYNWATPFNFQLPSYGAQYHAYFFRRARANATWGVLDENLYTTQNVGNITALSTVDMAICAQNFSGGPNSFWNGTWAYFALWTEALPINGNAGQPSIVSNYNLIRPVLATRGLYMSDVMPSLYPSRIYQRQGRLVSSTGAEIAGANEKVLYSTTDCRLVANPCFQIVYDGSVGGVKYAEIPYNAAAKTMGAVVIQPSALISSGHSECSFVKNSATLNYMMLCSNGTGGTGTQLDLYTSNSTGNATAFTLTQAGVITVSGIGATYINNSSIVQPSSLGGTFYVAYDYAIGASTYVGAATSTNLTSFIQNPANPVVGVDNEGLGGPSLNYVNVNGVYSWQIWCHGTIAIGIYRVRAAAWASHWQRTSPSGYPILGQAIPVATPDAPDETSQMASASPIDIGDGNTYLFYCASDASNNLYLKLMIAPMPMTTLVLTGEGTASATP